MDWRKNNTKSLYDVLLIENLSAYGSISYANLYVPVEAYFLVLFGSLLVAHHQLDDQTLKYLKKVLSKAGLVAELKAAALLKWFELVVVHHYQPG